MKTEHQHIDEALIGLYLSGNANTDEIQQVESWMNTNDENRSEFLRFKKLWEEAIDVEEIPNFNVDSAWNKVQKEINNNGKVIPLQKIVKKNLSWISAAASVILILAIGIYYYSIGGNTISEINYTAQNGFESFFLPDSSEVILSKGSSLSFDENFNVSERKTSLKGQALFKVRKNPEKTFIVDAGSTEIRVLGTEFIVYSDKDSSVTSVSTGKVQVNKKNDKSKNAILTSGMNAIVTSKNPSIEVNEINNNERFVFDKTLIFNQTPLNEVIEILHKFYKVQIILSQKELGACQLTATFKDEQIQNILEIISTTFGLNLTEEDSQFVLSGEAC
jgi:transmembrane sensor